MGWAYTIFVIIASLLVLAIFALMAYSIFFEVQTAGEKKKKVIIQNVAILVVCAIIFTLCKTVFKETMSDWWYVLNGGPEVTLGDNFSIRWRSAPRIEPITDDVDIEDVLKGLVDQTYD